eukprot:scaffold45453_cov32-Tisochrysis_lutea.AAC.2
MPLSLSASWTPATGRGRSVRCNAAMGRLSASRIRQAPRRRLGSRLHPALPWLFDRQRSVLYARHSYPCINCHFTEPCVVDMAKERVRLLDFLPSGALLVLHLSTCSHNRRVRQTTTTLADTRTMRRPF